MKLFKKLAALCMAITLCAGVSAMTACGGDNGGDSSSQQSTGATAYLFKVVNADGSVATTYTFQKEDGTTVENPISIQLCSGLEMCYNPCPVDENGCATYNTTTVSGFPGAGVYDIHILGGGAWGSDYIEFDGPAQTATEYSSEYIVLTLK